MSTTNNRSNWRQRMVEKERREREAVAAAAEQERLKHTVLNETNFPSHLVSTAHPLTYRLPLNGFASRAAEAEEKDARQKLIQEHKRHRARMDRITSDVFTSGLHRVRTSHRRRNAYEEDEEEIQPTMTNHELNELYPRHRGRHFSTEPDSEGWREVIRYTRKKRVLSEAELERKARAEILGEDSEDEEDLNGDLTDRNQRRDFY